MQAYVARVLHSKGPGARRGDGVKEWPTGPDDVELLVWTESEDREARGDIFWGNEVPATHFVIFPVKGLRRRKASAVRGMYPTRRMPLLMLPEPVLSPPEHHPCGTSEKLAAAAECSEVSHERRARRNTQTGCIRGASRMQCGHRPGVDGGRPGVDGGVTGCSAHADCGSHGLQGLWSSLRHCKGLVATMERHQILSGDCGSAPV